MLQALREEPPSNTKCKDKFLIQSTLITPEKQSLSLGEIVRFQWLFPFYLTNPIQWNVTGDNEEAKVHQQKLRVTYLPAEGQTLEEEEEPQQPAQNSFLHPGYSVRPFPNFPSCNLRVSSAAIRHRPPAS